MITLDFETYSEAGYGPNLEPLPGAQKAGISGVNAHVYAEHPTTRPLMLAYDLDDGRPVRLWVEGMAPPIDLFARIADGEPWEAHNSLFEYWVWNLSARRLYGWPELPLATMRCSMSRAAAAGHPTSLAGCAQSLGVDAQKDKRGTALINKFSTPKPTRVALSEDPAAALEFMQYCIADVRAEHAVSAVLPQLPVGEHDVWLTDQRINDRGVAVDLEGVRACIRNVEALREAGTDRLREVTCGAVESVQSGKQLLAWFEANGLNINSVAAPAIEAALERDDLTDNVREVLGIRADLAGSAVSKLYAMQRLVSSDGRIRGTFMYYGAHTGRWAGRGIQPQNFPRGNSGVDVEESLARIKSGENLPLDVVTTCLRGLLVAGPGKELVSSDYAAIEAVVLAELAGEEWRKELFRTHGKIYEMSASKISGVPFHEMLLHKARTGSDHPLRKTLGKVAELASGYGGGLGSWKAFGADAFMSDEEIRGAVKAWRRESPAIVSFWYDVEAAVKNAIAYGSATRVGEYISVCRVGDDVHIVLPSGRPLIYRSARVVAVDKPWGLSEQIVFTDQYGQSDTYGGRLVENITQAVARDLLAYALLNLEAAGFDIVLHIHDEIVAEVPQGSGRLHEFESIMSRVPDWAFGWPVRASGGWCGHRFRKD